MKTSVAEHQHYPTKAGDLAHTQPNSYKDISYRLSTAPERTPQAPILRAVQSYLGTMVVFALLIINKAGGLVYNRTFHPGLNTLSSNDLLILAGTFHGVHAITASLIPHSLHPSNNLPPSTSQNTASQNFPIKATGLEVLESSHFRLTCFQTLTGTKFLLLTEPAQPNVDVVIRRVYELYADFVMKNPFYTVEMPVRCAKFDSGLDTYIKARS